MVQLKQFKLQETLKKKEIKNKKNVKYKKLHVYGTNICDKWVKNDNYEKKNANNELQRVLRKKRWCKNKK